jgi:tRNA threonylcarbamoyladenosine biosynthesis protein TsaB
MKSPRILIIETSSRIGQVAVASGNQVLRTRQLEETRRHARDLAPAVKDLLSEEAWRAGDINLVLVSRGPGSYTGLRVGIMSAKAFAYATGCNIMGIDTFHAIACQAPAEADSVDVISDAQQGRVYHQRFDRRADIIGGWHAATPLAIRQLEEWRPARDPAAWISGPALQLYQSRLQGEERLVLPADRDPRPESLLGIGLGRYQAGELDDCWGLEPLYLRPSSAEEKWDRRQ